MAERSTRTQSGSRAEWHDHRTPGASHPRERHGPRPSTIGLVCTGGRRGTHRRSMTNSTPSTLAWPELLAEQDATRFASCHTDDARLLSHGQPIIPGSSRVRGRGPRLGHERAAPAPLRDRRRDRRRLTRRGHGPDRQPRLGGASTTSSTSDSRTGASRTRLTRAAAIVRRRHLADSPQTGVMSAGRGREDVNRQTGSATIPRPVPR
jgi:hypothetical protein